MIARHDGAPCAAMHCVFKGSLANVFANAAPNFNRLYVAVPMAAPMVIIDPLVMRAMYPSRRWNGAAAAIVRGLVVF